MNQHATPDLKQGLERFKQFRLRQTGERSFHHPTCHPSQSTGFCPCDQAWPATLWFYFKSALLLTALKLPFNGLKIALLRWSGARVGRDVFIATDVWIDPSFPELLTIEDGVMVGVGAKIFFHLFNRDYFQAWPRHAAERRDYRCQRTNRSRRGDRSRGGGCLGRRGSMRCAGRHGRHRQSGANYVSRELPHCGATTS